MAANALRSPSRECSRATIPQLLAALRVPVVQPVPEALAAQPVPEAPLARVQQQAHLAAAYAWTSRPASLWSVASAASTPTPSTPTMPPILAQARAKAASSLRI